MAWETRKIEEKLKELLIKEYQSSRADDLFSQYIEARRVLVEQILPQIKAIEKDLTDHSEDHIANVLDNVYRLLDNEIETLDPIALYFLCMIVLFHDVGNIHGRTGHYDRAVIQEIYNYVRKEDSKYNGERTLVCSVASTHSGLASDGSTDTLKGLSDKPEGLFQEGIYLRKLAAVLRFADELAEGPQRTSDYMLINNKYEKDNEIHHKYAQVTTVFIDRGNGRIALTYDINIKAKKENGFSEEDEEDLTKLLTYIYKRIIKLNDERRYNKFYSDLLEPFNSTNVRFNFHLNGLPIDIGLSDLNITDLRIPGESSKQIPNLDESYKIDSIIQNIKSISTPNKDYGK